jgi:hypothetical protein
MAILSQDIGSAFESAMERQRKRDAEIRSGIACPRAHSGNGSQVDNRGRRCRHCRLAMRVPALDAAHQSVGPGGDHDSMS